MADGFVLGPGEGATFAYLGGLGTYKVSVDETGSWGVAIETSPAGFASALHIHHTEESGFYVLRGRMLVRCGDVDLEAGPESFVFLPRAIAHAFKVVSDEPATWLNVQGPSGDFRKFVEETGMRLPEPAWPPPVPEIDVAARVAAAARHNLEILGPAPWS